MKDIRVPLYALIVVAAIVYGFLIFFGTGVTLLAIWAVSAWISIPTNYAFLGGLAFATILFFHLRVAVTPDRG